jgi:hypothetical protein
MLNSLELRQMKSLFGNTDRVIGVYRKPDSDVKQFNALNPDVPMPERHPLDRDYRLVGVVNPRTGALIAPGDSGGHDEASPGHGRGVLTWVWRVVVGIAMVSAALAMMLVGTLLFGRPTGRGR